MSKIIMNSRNDIGLIKDMITGFEVVEAITESKRPEPAILMVNLVMSKELPFEIASTDEELKPLVERFKQLLEIDK